MNVHKLLMTDVTTHKATMLEFPPAGIVLITGPNGAGKSSIIEGVACAGWGDTLRGTPPWAGPSGELELFANEVHAVRTRKNSKVSLLWDTGGVATKYETPTKAQEALDRVLGPFGIWRRAHVFSSHDAAHFTLATDAERKRLLETILGLERFDIALKGCREDLKAALNAHSNLKSALDALRAKLAAEWRRLREAEEGLVLLPKAEEDDAGARARSNELAKLVTSIRGELGGLQRRIRGATIAGSERDGYIREIERRLSTLAKDACPTCEQPIPGALLERLRADVQGERAKQSEERAAAALTLGDDREMESELREQETALTVKGGMLSAGLGKAAEVAVQRARFAKLIQEAKAAVESMTAEANAQEVKQEVATKDLAELSAVERVLGIKGVRAQMLGRAVKGLEKVANAWLARIVRPGFEVKLPMDNDKIGLEINGAGGGYGYKASSGGERRRVDIALVLALAEVASAAGGVRPGTLFFDEVFDALDEEGVERVTTALRDLSQERCVVIVTHNMVLSSRLAAARRWRVDPEGNVTEKAA